MMLSLMGPKIYDKLPLVFGQEGHEVTEGL